MKLTVLADNNTLISRYFLAEPGLSMFIQAEDRRILLDCGYSHVFLQNAQRAGIDLLHLDTVAFSHGHLDHTWGLTDLMRKFSRAVLEDSVKGTPRILAHPRAFVSVQDERGVELGSMLSRDKVEQNFPLQLSIEPVYLTTRLVWLGEIPRKTSFESRKPLGCKADDLKPDYVPDDTALAYLSPEGLVIVTGCSHSGICNIVEHARRVTGEERVVDIIGGLHLQSPKQDQLSGTIHYLSTLNLKDLHACHCTDLNSKIALGTALPLREVGSGMQLTYLD